MDALVADQHALRRLALAATALDVIGARIAVPRGLVGEPLLISVPAELPAGVVLAGWGTALSAPLLMDGALGALSLAGDSRGATSRAVRALGMLRLVGVLVEPVTWGRRAPRWAMLISVGHVAIAASLIRQAGRPPARPFRSTTEAP